MKESDLYQPLKVFFENLGYEVYAEVGSHDLAAKKTGNSEEFILVEMKLKFSLQLVYQGIQASEKSEQTYLAIPGTADKPLPPHIKDVTRLLKRLGLGLLIVRFLKTKTDVMVYLEPEEYHPRKMKKKRLRLNEEINNRLIETGKGGISTRYKRMTAYRQQCILVAELLKDHPGAGGAAIKKRGGPANSGSILYSNYYGWFSRSGKGRYTLSSLGEKALLEYASESEAILYSSLRKEIDASKESPRS